jgi:hypothetical protein
MESTLSNRRKKDKITNKICSSYKFYTQKLFSDIIMGIVVIIIILIPIILSLAAFPYIINKSNYESETQSFDENEPRSSISSTPEWSKTFGGTTVDYGIFVWSDGAFIYTTGYTESFGAGQKDLVLIKWNSDGGQIWYKTWGGTSDDIGQGIWGDGTYIYTTGVSKSFGAGQDDLIIIKWDLAGNQIWNKTWGGIGNDGGNVITGNGTHIYIAGYTASYGAGSNDVLMMKWDTNGSVIWNKTWGGSYSEQAYFIWLENTDLYITGSTASYGSGLDDLLISRWDTDGNMIWYKTWGGSDYDYGSGIWKEGNNIYVSGHAVSFGAGRRDMTMSKWDLSGNQVWFKTWGGVENDQGSFIWGDGTYLYIAGSTNTYGSGLYDLLIVKWDMNGNALSYKTWGGIKDDYTRCMCMNGTSLYITGFTENYGEGGYDLLLLKWDIGDSTSSTSSGTSSSTSTGTSSGTSTNTNGSGTPISAYFTPEIIGGLIALIIGIVIVVSAKARSKKSKTSSTQNKKQNQKLYSPNKEYINREQQWNEERQTVIENRRAEEQRLKLEHQRIQTQRQIMEKQITDDQEFLERFQKIMKMSKSIKKVEVAELLGIPETELLHRLLDWSEQLPFKIDGDMIIVEDISAFTAALDKQFSDWEDSESTKYGKIE